MSGRKRIIAVADLAASLRDAGLDRETRRFVIEGVAARGRFIGGRPRVLPSRANRYIYEEFMAGVPVPDLVIRSGLSKFHVHSIINVHLAPRTMRDVIAERRKAAEDQRVLDELLRRMAQERRCSICGSYVLRGDSYETCSPACARLLQTSSVRYWNNDEKRERHRQQQAKTILRRPWKYKPSMVEWAKRMQSDNPPPPNRTWIAPQNRDLARGLGVENLGRVDQERALCPVTNLDGSPCKRRVVPGEVCHIHARRVSAPEGVAS